MGRRNGSLRAQPQIDDCRASVAANPPIAGEVEFRNLTSTFPTNIAGNGAASSASSNGNAAHPVLHDINLRIPAGSTLAIVGPTGSGKTTLAALVARPWEAPEDELLIDSLPIRD